MELTLAHRLVLLSLDPATGARRQRQAMAFAVCGAVLADLALAGRIGLAEKRVAVLDRDVTPHSLLNDALARIAEGRPARPHTWCVRLQRVVRVRAVLDDLVRLGYVRRQQSRLLGLVPVTRYPVLATGVVEGWRAALRNVVALGVTPTSDADAQLARLLFEVGLRKVAFGPVPRSTAKARVLAIDSLRWPGDGVRTAIQSARAASASAGS